MIGQVPGGRHEGLQVVDDRAAPVADVHDRQEPFGVARAVEPGPRHADEVLDVVVPEPTSGLAGVPAGAVGRPPSPRWLGGSSREWRI